MEDKKQHSMENMPLLKNDKKPDAKKWAEVTVRVTGMTCGACVSLIESAMVDDFKGKVRSCSVNLIMEEATLVYDPVLVTVDELLKGINDIEPKFKAYPFPEDDDAEAGLQVGKQKEDQVKKYRRLFFLSLIFAIPTGAVTLSALFSSGHLYLYKGNLDIRTVLFGLLATPVQFWLGWDFHYNAVMGLRRFSMTMDTLVSVGTMATYLYSLGIAIYEILNPEFNTPVFFETSTYLITFIALGKAIEAYARGKTSTALTDLLALRVKETIRIIRDEKGNLLQEEKISLKEVKVGNTLKIEAGQTVPTDGIVVEGKTTVNEAMLTGESVPRERGPNDEVIGGTINIDGLVYIRATKIGKQTALAQIIDQVKKASTDKAEIQKLADKIAARFVPFVVTLSILDFIIWFLLAQFNLLPKDYIPANSNKFLFAFIFAVSVMVISCPCSFGLATPTAVMVGTGLGARNGILIKGGSVLEKAHKTEAIIFDKTGTLTYGQLRVSNTVLQLNFLEVKQFYHYIASAEANNPHPLAKAICSVALKKKIPLAEAKESTTFAGKGLKCKVDGKEVLVGNSSWMKDNNIEIPEHMTHAAGELEDQAKSVVWAAVEGQLAGVIGLMDMPRSEAPYIVEELKRRGIEVWMVTGDRRKTALAIAKQLKITNVMAEVLPGDKATKVKELQGKGRVVAMVGDGINDAAALTAADVGMAIGAGTDIAMECANIVLIKSDLVDVLTALDLARTTYRRILWNFVWALFFNGLGIPLAAGVFYPAFRYPLPPEAAGLAMAFSSITVVSSSLLLYLYKKPVFKVPLESIIVKDSPLKEFGTIAYTVRDVM